MASSATGSNASPNIFAVNPNGYVTILTSPLWIPFYPTEDVLNTRCGGVVKQAKVTVGNAEGYECSRCLDFYPMAELNQPDEAIECTYFTCYSCRKGLKTFFKDTGESK